MAGAFTAHGRRQDTKASHTMANGVSCTRRRPGRPRLNWIDTVTQDFKSIGMACKEAEQAAVDREDWRVRVTQCVFDTG